MRCLFENYRQQPKDLAKIVAKYIDIELKKGLDYPDLERFLKECEAIGYTFEYYLTTEPYALRPIGVPINQVEGFEDC